MPNTPTESIFQRLTDAGLRGEERYTLAKPYAATAPAAAAGHQARMGDQNGRAFPLFAMRGWVVRNKVGVGEELYEKLRYGDREAQMVGLEAGQRATPWCCCILWHSAISSEPTPTLTRLVVLRQNTGSH
jgi:hypothetical protein